MTIPAIPLNKLTIFVGAFALSAAIGLREVNGQSVGGQRPTTPGSGLFARPGSVSSATVAARFSRSPQRDLLGHPRNQLVAKRVDDAVAIDSLSVGPLLPAPERYWIVSSRKLPQELPWVPGRPLEVFERVPGGPLVKSDMLTLVSEIRRDAPVCIFVHGTFVSAEWHQQESAHTYEWVRNAASHLPLNVIFFTWPSDDNSRWLNPFLINQRGQWAENNGFYLAELIGYLPPECPVCLVGHSHGGRAVASTLHLLGGGHVGGYYFPYDPGASRRYRAVLAAAAFDRHWLNPGQRYERALCRTEGILNLCNPGDLALHIYPFRRPFSRQAIGETGLTLWDRARLGALNGRAIDLDVSPLLGLSHTWPFFYNEPRIAQAIVPYTYFVDE